jgi:hypothetical protein
MASLDVGLQLLTPRLTMLILEWVEEDHSVWYRELEELYSLFAETDWATNHRLITDLANDLQALVDSLLWTSVLPRSLWSHESVKIIELEERLWVAYEQAVEDNLRRMEPGRILIIANTSYLDRSPDAARALHCTSMRRSQRRGQVTRLGTHHRA